MRATRRGGRIPRSQPPWWGIVSTAAGRRICTETSAAHPLVETLKRAVGEVVGRPPVVRGATYGSDLRLFTNDFGIPGVLFGPGDIRQAHFTDESVSIAEVELAARALARTVVEYCGVA